MTHFKSLTLAACLIAGISFTATGYAGTQCFANGNNRVTCSIGSYIIFNPGACNWSYTNYAGTPGANQVAHANCGSGSTPSFACGTSNGTWAIDMANHQIN